MKRSILIIGTLFMSAVTFAQQDSVRVERNEDTIRIGGMVIVKSGVDSDKRVVVKIGDRSKTRKKVKTSALAFDLGFANWTDNTNYGAANASGALVHAPGQANLGESDFKIRTGKSINVNIWLLSQNVSLVNHYVNLKYALGLELNNYRFKEAISFKDGGVHPYLPGERISHSYVFRDSVSFSKNKLAADYLTLPVMLNFNTNPYGKNGLNVSAGVSMGFLYSARNKQVSGERGKRKNGGDYDLEKWKFSYVGEIGFGSVGVYGSYSPNSIFKNDLDFTPFTVGLRLWGW